MILLQKFLSQLLYKLLDLVFFIFYYSLYARFAWIARRHGNVFVCLLID